MENAILLFFLFLVFLVFLYSLSQLNLLLNYLEKKKERDSSEKFDFSNPEEIPFISIQLPIYNERNVVERLLKNIAEMDYPREKLEIQVLDDSTDDSLALISSLVLELRKTGLEIHHLHRSDRKGYKAGALKEGLKSAKGEFIVIFDSDFLPEKDWLKKTIPYFKNENLGVVQTRWGHLNRNYSLLTKIQAFALDFHFLLEQNGRNFGRHFINFNGTAGVWRKKCILDAGNWMGDTLTEDLDLSYRAQLKGWKFKYLEEVITPAELPVTIAAARSQQFRWNKGAAENFQKSSRKLLLDKNLPFATKIHGFFHLLNSSLFLLILLMAILSLPVLLIIDGQEYLFFKWSIAFLSLSSLIFFYCYWSVFPKAYHNQTRSFINYLGMFFSFFSIAMGFSVHNSRAVLEGHFGKKSAFVRTPKFNLIEKGQVRFLPKKEEFHISFQLILECMLLLYFGFAIYLAFELNNYSMLIFHMMLFFGFGFVVLKSMNFHFFRPHKFWKPVRRAH